MRRWRGLGFYLTLWVAMMVVRQDSWLWHDRTLLFDVIPIGLAYQAGYSILAALVMRTLVRWDWPAELDALEQSSSASPAERRG